MFGGVQKLNNALQPIAEEATEAVASKIPPRQPLPYSIGFAPASKPTIINALPSSGVAGGIDVAPLQMGAKLEQRALAGGGDFIVPAAKAETGLPRVQMEAKLEQRALAGSTSELTPRARVEPPAITGVPEQKLLPGGAATPSQIAAEVGLGTPDRVLTFDINGVTDNLAETVAKPKPLLEAAKAPATLAELVQQSTNLASHRSVLDTVLERLEQLFKHRLGNVANCFTNGIA